MTNKEILQADMLDILFEHRNKLYGAYALRRFYSKRLVIALSVSLSTVILFMLMSFINKKDGAGNHQNNPDAVKITQVIIPEDKPKEPNPPKEKPKPITAQVDYQPPVIVEDDKVKDILPTITDIDSADISNKTIDGLKATDVAKPKTDLNENGDGDKKPNDEKEEILPPSRQPQFPGGDAAWIAFLRRYLQAPEDLEPGQRVEVVVQFWVDVDGSVSRTAVLKSGGLSFDKEVLRVLKKMPKWEPALQHGNPVAIAYSQPVTFMGVEQ